MYITVLFNGRNVLAMQSSHVLCNPFSYRNVPYRISGLIVYIYTCSPFCATSIRILNVVIMRTCTRGLRHWDEF